MGFVIEVFVRSGKTRLMNRMTRGQMSWASHGSAPTDTSLLSRSLAPRSALKPTRGKRRRTSSDGRRFTQRRFRASNSGATPPICARSKP